MEYKSLSSSEKTEVNKAQNPLEKAEVYAKHYYWNESLNLVAKMKDKKPQAWQELLKSIKIQQPEIVKANIIELVK